MARKDRQAAPRAKNIYLTGFMCAGKTSAGRALSRALGLPFRDSDELIEKEAGRTVAELVRSKGLARFRSLEAAQVRKLASSGGRVIALTTEGNKELNKLADDVIFIPKTLEMLTPILAIVPLQLLAYYCAIFKHRDVDKPRNLAKSVTVE